MTVLIASIAGALAISLVGRQLWEVLPWMAQRLLTVAIWLLPLAERDRSEEEWSADLARVPGGLLQVLWSLGCITVSSRRALAAVTQGDGQWPTASPILVTATTVLPWPWAPQPSAASVQVVGDISDAIRLGVARDATHLEQLSNWLAVGAGTDPCLATWTLERANACAVTVTAQAFRYRQRFVLTRDGGLAAEFAELYQAVNSQPGVARQVLQNTLSVFDEAGVRYVTIYAETPTHSVVWAALGAEPLDADVTRLRLMELLSEHHGTGGFTPSDSATLAVVVENTSNGELMQAVFRVRGCDGGPVGEDLLGQFAWQAFIDLSDPAQRQRLIGVLTS